MLGVEWLRKNGFKGHTKSLDKKPVHKLPRAKRKAKRKRLVHQFPRAKREAKKKRLVHQLPGAKRKAKKKGPFHQLPRAKREAKKSDLSTNFLERNESLGMEIGPPITSNETRG